MRRTKIKIELKNVKTNWYCTFAPNFLHVPTQECILLWAKRILQKERAVFRPQKVLFISLRIKVLFLSVLWMPEKVFLRRSIKQTFCHIFRKGIKSLNFYWLSSSLLSFCSIFLPQRCHLLNTYVIEWLHR